MRVLGSWVAGPSGRGVDRPPKPELRLARTDAEFEALRPDWERLYAGSDPRNPFLSFAWNAACRRHLCPAAASFVVSLWRGDRLVGLAPLRMERRWGFRVLRFIGEGRSDYQGFLTSPELPNGEAELLDALNQLRGEWDLALLRQLADGWTDTHRLDLPGALSGHGIEADLSPYLAMPEDWNKLLADGPPSVRRGRRAARKLEKEGGIVECVRGSAVAEAIDLAGRIEDGSWKAVRGIQRFAPGPPRELLREAALELGPSGEMELWLARVDGRPIAFLLNFLTSDQVWYYQGAFDEAFRTLYPGMALHFRCIERAFAEGRRIYDFLSGPEPYKANWTNAARPLRYRALYPECARGYLAYGLLVAPRWALRRSRTARAALAHLKTPAIRSRPTPSAVSTSSSPRSVRTL